MLRYKTKYPVHYQTNSMDCGLACLRMICAFHGKQVSIERLRSISEFEINGVSMYGLSGAARQLGFEAKGVMIELAKIRDMAATTPMIVHWKKKHFVVVYGRRGQQYVVADPARGLMRVGEKEFARHAQQQTDDGLQLAYALVLEPTPAFAAIEEDQGLGTRGLQMLWQQVGRFRPYFMLIFWALLLGLGVQFLLPFFTKSIVDIGVASSDIRYVGYILAGQVVLVLSSTLFTVIRGWLTLHLSARINYALISAFLQKLFRVPLTFFETRKIGDILQRIGDHQRIEGFITRVALGIIFSFLSIIVYSCILAYYNMAFLFLFMGSATVYIAWILLFLKARKKIDWKRFEVSSKSQSILIQMVNGMHDLKINNAQQHYFEKWKLNQRDHIDNSFGSLRLYQFQETGATLIFQVAQIAITFMSVKLVIEGRITLGAMLSIQFIIGQLIGPIEQVINAITLGQDARISIERLMDIWHVKDEKELLPNRQPARDVPLKKDISFRNLYFKYAGQEHSFALNDINLDIPEGKVTAIVGLSGSGKTTLLKLLLGYYRNYQGQLKVGGEDLHTIDIDAWRMSCGVVMQESFVFSDTIARNISMSDTVDAEKLAYALSVANIQQYVQGLPLQHNTVVGAEGKGISHGQRQRILIARAVYKDPQFIFFDEATNSLDAENETIIINNLKAFFKGRTVLIIAHRLSTIQFADKILMIEGGRVIEEGSSGELVKRKGRYYDLVRRQLQEEGAA